MKTNSLYSNRSFIVLLSLLLCYPFQNCFSQEFKTSLLQDYSGSNQEKYPEHPYLAKFENKKKILLYVAARHEVEVDNDTVKIISKTFTDYHPQIVIIEGFQPESLHKALEEEIKTCQSKKFKDCSESVFTGFLAKTSGARIVTGEPSDRMILDELIKKGYSIQDYLGFYLLRQIPQWKREHKIDNNLEELSNKFLKICLSEVGEKSNFDFKAFKSWYKDKEGQRFQLGEISENTVAREKQLFMNKLWLALERVREKNILITIETAMKQYDTVMIVYGASHFTVENVVLTDYFGGAPVITKP